MQSIHVPSLGVRYWFALCLASIFGANMGDFFAHVLGLGHIKGVPFLAIALVAVLLFERRDKVAHQAYYWTAIILVRTAATNLADLAASDMKQPRPWIMLVLAILLAGVAALRVPRATSIIAREKSDLPTTDSQYWLCMLVAGTLGTVLGDFTAGDAGLGLANASIVLSCLLGFMFFFGQGRLQTIALYWSTIVMVRAAGTTVGDFFASKRGLGLGLPMSTAATGLVFVLALLLWRERRGATVNRTS